MWDEGEMLLKQKIFASIEFIVYNFKDDLFRKACVPFYLKESTWEICACIIIDKIGRNKLSILK